MGALARRIRKLFSRPAFIAARGLSEGEAYRRGALALFYAASDDSWFSVKFNGVQAVFPRYTLLTMRHCLHFDADARPYFLVETAHWEAMRSWLDDGDVFLDVGAATGAMCVPFDLGVEKDIRLIAFEPSRRARNYLEQTLDRNECRRSTVYRYAISDRVGGAEFVEMPFDSDGKIPWLPETSHLYVGGDGGERDAVVYKVDVATLDSLATELNLLEANKLVIKIDVEGFEGEVLRGAKNLIRRQRPWFSIDIHLKPGQNFDTEEEVCGLLAGFGYKFDRIGHVLLATPGRG
ncbi:MAG: FkbM family methyltransferase [Planctomycetota bacterium]|nr:FkbM family methyltransferase [Planctomycetota bacterium]